MEMAMYPSNQLKTEYLLCIITSSKIYVFWYKHVSIEYIKSLHTCSTIYNWGLNITVDTTVNTDNSQ